MWCHLSRYHRLKIIFYHRNNTLYRHDAFMVFLLHCPTTCWHFIFLALFKLFSLKDKTIYLSLQCFDQMHSLTLTFTATLKFLEVNVQSTMCNASWPKNSKKCAIFWEGPLFLRGHVDSFLGLLDDFRHWVSNRATNSFYTSCYNTFFLF